MLLDARRVPDGQRIQADLCVIGGGAAGITLGRRFAGSTTSVVVLEAGGVEYDDEAQDMYDGPSVGLPYFPLRAARLRQLGGSTNHWGGLCAPFLQKDFEERNWIPHSGWPIGLEDVEPYYREARRIVRLRSDAFDLDDWQDRDRYGPLDLGEGVEARVAQMVKKSRRSFSDAYADELERARNVDVYLQASVSQIVVAVEGSTIEKVEVATVAGTRFDVRARHVVLAAGGIENARLLLASTAVRPNGLGNDHDLVGRYFIEHPRFEAAVIVPSSPDLRMGFYEPHHVNGTELRGYIALPDAIQRREELVDVQIITEPVYALGFEGVKDSADVDTLRDAVRAGRSADLGELGPSLLRVVDDLSTATRFALPGAPLPLPYPEVLGAAERDVPGLLGDIGTFAYRRLKGSAPMDHIRLRTRLDPVPNPDSRVTLAGERDALGMPRAQLDWRLSDIDKHSAARTAELIGRAFAARGLGRLRMSFDPRENEWPDDLTGGWHHMGTTRMSDDPTTGVVDRNCQVHGIPNLHIAGSSVFCTGASSTPTMTIVALALRLADRLGQLLR